MLKREIFAVVAIALRFAVAHAGELQPAPAPSSLYQPGSAVQAPPLRVEVLDGTRFRDIETGAVYRLYGIATCLPGQVARLARQPWACGSMATAWLVTATLGKWLSCATLQVEAGERLARCASADHPDLAGAMVRDGVAVTLPPTERDPSVRAYVSAERDARKAYRGLWASSFEMPWDYSVRLFHGENPALRPEAGQ